MSVTGPGASLSMDSAPLAQRASRSVFPVTLDRCSHAIATPVPPTYSPRRYPPRREEHPRRPKRVLRAVVVHRCVLAVPDELDTFAHTGVRTVRDAAVNAGSASAAKT